MTISIAAEDLHAGDWIKCPEDNAGGCWVMTRRREGDTLSFLFGRGPGHVHKPVVMAPTDQIELLARWPLGPGGRAS